MFKSIFLAGGGTGGHAFPLASVAKKLMKNHSILWLGSLGRIEEEIAEKEAIPFYGLQLNPFRLGGIFKRIKALYLSLKGFFRVLLLLLRHRPRVVVCFGGYASFPVGLAAVFSRTPLCLHEQNSKMGLSNRILAPFAEKIWLGLPLEGGVMGKKMHWLEGMVQNKLVLTENPTMLTPNLESHFEKKEGAVRLVLLGGSGGALRLNQWMCHTYLNILKYAQSQKEEAPFLWHQCGPLQYKKTQELYQTLGVKTTDSLEELNSEVRVCLNGFVSSMDILYQWADLAFARGGAISLEELYQAKLPSWIVPLPLAADNHQEHNARVYERLGLCKVVHQKDLDSLEVEQLMPPLLTRESLKVCISKIQPKKLPQASLFESIEQFIAII